MTQTQTLPVMRNQTATLPGNAAVQIGKSPRARVRNVTIAAVVVVENVENVATSVATITVTTIAVIMKTVAIMNAAIMNAITMTAVIMTVTIAVTIAVVAVVVTRNVAQFMSTSPSVVAVVVVATAS